MLKYIFLNAIKSGGAKLDSWAQKYFLRTDKQTCGRNQVAHGITILNICIISSPIDIDKTQQYCPDLSKTTTYITHTESTQT